MEADTMSKWTEIRDSVLDKMNLDEVTEKGKQDFVKWLVETLLPIAEAYADKFIDQIKAQAESETGWCKARDMIVLPFVINGGLWLIKKVLTETMDNTAE
jgi:hypothetical protein